MNGRWPVPGHKFWYKTSIRLEDGRELNFDLTLPGARQQVDIATLRLGRHGGPTGKDNLFRSRLYERIGAVTVAGGHAETAMKRLVLLLRGEADGFSVVDWTWTDLQKALDQEADRADDGRRKRLARVLAWGREKDVKKRRDNVVHASWWDFDGIGVIRSRFFRRSDGATILGSLQELEEDAEVVAEYARRLDDLLGEDWPRAMLPGVG